MNPVSLRLLGQQLICPQFSTPHDVVSWMGAMQGQEYSMMRWAVAMRTKRPSAKAFAKDFDSGRIIRTHLLRTTWQLVAAEDYAWMLSLCRSKALSGLRGWMHTNGIDIPQEEEERISAIFAERVSGHADVLKEDLAQALAERDVRMDDHRLSYHIRLAELSGLLCSGVLHPRKRTLALASERVPPKASPPGMRRWRCSPANTSVPTVPPPCRISSGGADSISAIAGTPSACSARNCTRSAGNARRSTSTKTAGRGGSGADASTCCPPTTSISSATRAATSPCTPTTAITHTMAAGPSGT